MTSSPYAAPHSCLLFACMLAALGCSDGNGLGDNPDGSFGTGAGTSPRDAGMDGALPDLDASSQGGGPTVNVRFLNAIPNTGALLVCHDPDGPGPIAASVLGGTPTLRAEFGRRSPTLRVPALASGALTLQRAVGADAGTDGGSPDGGAEDPCAAATREATIPLPITGAWLAPRDPLTQDELSELDLLRTLESDAPSLTLLGSGVALNASRVDALALQARVGASDEVAAEALARAALTATFGPRALIQPDRTAASSETFSLSVFHGVADVPPAADAPANSAVGGLRVCVTSGTLDRGALPELPAPAIPFRVRSELGREFTARQSYAFRAYAAADFDTAKQDCATTSLSPVAQASFEGFVGGRAYTLAIVGAIAPSALCSAQPNSLVRASCWPYPSELGARIELLED